MTDTPKPTRPSPAPIFCDEFRFDTERGMLVLKGAHSGTFHVSMAMTLNLAMDLTNKLGEHIANVIRPPVAPVPESGSAVMPEGVNEERAARRRDGHYE